MNYSSVGRTVAEQLKDKDGVMIYRHIEGVSAKPTFSKCRKFRYKLDIQLNGGSGNKTACVIMLNPSMANADIADKSVNFLEKLFFQKDFQKKFTGEIRPCQEFKGITKLIIVNLFAFIQTREFNCDQKRVGPENDSHIRKALATSNVVLIAWGAKGNPCCESRENTVKSLIKKSGNKNSFLAKKHPALFTYKNFLTRYPVAKNDVESGPGTAQ